MEASALNGGITLTEATRRIDAAVLGQAGHISMGIISSGAGLRVAFNGDTTMCSL